MDINERWLKLAQRINEIIWDNPGTKHQLFDKTATIMKYVRGHVHAIEYGNMLFLTQNPLKDTAYGHMASAGHKIIWGIYRKKKGPRTTQEYRLLIVDGEVSLEKEGAWEPLGKLSEQNQHVPA